MTNTLTNTSSVPEGQRQQHDYILLDGSSSMRDNWWNTLEAVESYVQTLKASNVNSHIILQTFDSHELDLVQRDCDIAKWESLKLNPIGAYWGSTPLYDAVNVMSRRLRDLNPPRCSIVIVTDGEENTSRHTDVHQAKALLDWCRAKGWQITFIGAGFDNSRQAQALGSDAASAIGVSQRLLPAAVEALAKKRASYGLYGTPMHYTEGEQQQFGGYLNAPSQGS